MKINMLVADYIIDYLAKLGIEYVFQIYGSASGSLVDAFSRIKGIEYISCQHEQACGFAAEGYAKISGKFGVAMSTSGPGATNLVTPIANCYYDSVPCLFITGNVNSKFMRPSEDVRQIGFQETDIVTITKSITKHAVMVKNAEDVRYELEKALFLMKANRPGPVLIDIPLDIQKQEIDPEKLIGFQSEILPTANDSLIHEFCLDFLADLREAKRPCLLIGGGVQIANGAKVLWELLEILKIPAFPTWNAIDVISSDHPCFGGRVGTFGGAGRNFGIQNCDLLLSIGSRISGRITGGQPHTFAREAKKYIVDIDPANLQRKLQQVKFDKSLLCDAKQFIEQFIECLTFSELVIGEKTIIPDFSGWMNQVIGWREKYDPVLPEYYKEKNIVHPYVFARILSEEMGENDILVSDCGGNVVVIHHAFKTKQNQRCLSNHGHSCMGQACGIGLGAWFADKNHGKRRVIVTVGDGGLMMQMSTLQTLLTYNANVFFVCINTQSYGITKGFQDTNFDSRYLGCDKSGGYEPCDFIQLAKAFGMKNTRISFANSVQTYDENIRSQLQEALSQDGPMLIDVDCFDFKGYLPKVGKFDQPIEDQFPILNRDEFFTNMYVEPVEFSQMLK